MQSMLEFHSKSPKTWISPFLLTMSMITIHMTGLFNSFDSYSLILFSSWFMIFFLHVFPMENFFVVNSRTFSMKFFMKNFIENVYSELNKSKSFFSHNIFFLSLFTFIFLMNLFSLSGYIFSCTSHISINLNLGLMSWIMSIILIFVKLPTKFFSHLVPNNTPIYLISLLIMVEVLSNFIRPFVLAIRLTANLFAGHMLMSLLATIKLNQFSILIFFSSNLLFLFLELMVSFIQAYIFSLLSMIYFSETVN